MESRVSSVRGSVLDAMKGRDYLAAGVYVPSWVAGCMGPLTAVYSIKGPPIQNCIGGPLYVLKNQSI